MRSLVFLVWVFYILDVDFNCICDDIYFFLENDLKNIFIRLGIRE